MQENSGKIMLLHFLWGDYMNDENMNASVWYLFHSGFAVKTRQHFLVFDYYSDKPEGDMKCLGTGVINPEEIKDLDVVVFSSHKHSDHFNPVILNWAKRIKNISYVLSYDIGQVQGPEKVLYVNPGKEYDFAGMNIKVFDSTDIGVAFLVNCDGLRLYHAGDLNWWHWIGEPEDENALMGENYKKQINLLKGAHVDLAFVPMDPRLEECYLFGLDYFMKTVGAEMVFPMHFGKDYSAFKWFKEDDRAEEYRNKAVEITRRGQKFIYGQA